MRKNTNLKTFLVMVVLFNAQFAYGIVYVSVASGPWTAPGTWAPAGVPGVGDIAVVMAPDTVGLAVPGGIPVVGVSGLIVFGTVTAHFPVAATGMTMVIFSPTVGVAPGGSVLGEAGPVAGGGVVFVSPGMFGPPPPPVLPLMFPVGVFMNGGLISGGTGPAFGGSPIVFFANGMATNTGTIIGGASPIASGGSLVWGTTALNANGNITTTGIWGGTTTTATGSGGFATLLASTFPFGGLATATNGPVSFVRGGDGGTAVGAFGGSASVIALGVVGSAATNSLGAMIRGGDGCPPGTPFLFGTPTFNFGALVTGTNLCLPPPPPARMEPPEGMFSDGATMIGFSGEIAAGNLMTIGSLTNFPAIDLDEDLTIRLAPGGVLDLSDLLPGQIIAGGDVNIQADTVLLPDGLTLGDLMTVGGSINESPGARYALLSAIPDFHLTLSPGQTFELPGFVANIGNMSEGIIYDANDSSGWITPISGSGTYEPMDGQDFILTVNVPPAAIPGTTNVITIHGETTDLAAEITSEITIIVAGPLPGQAEYVFPENVDVTVAPSTDLSWNSGAGATSHDVYFGDTSPPPFVWNQTETTFTPPAPLELGTTYFWEIVEKGSGSDVPGGIWDFTVGYECDPPLVGDSDNNCILDMHDFANFAGSWLECTQVPGDFCP